MKISEHWLREWVNPPITTAELLVQLTQSGLEVDAVEPVAAAFSGVVVGRVLEVTPHPDAERLRIATVDVGQDTPLTIVCGAPNVAVGLYAPTALIGAQLPGGVNIKRSKLRGVESQGMLCSARELGLSDEAAGLMPLPPDLIPGTDVRVALGLDDQIIDINLTPNRSDCLSVAGIAREVGVLNRCPVMAVPADPVVPVLDDRLPITLSDPLACPRYIGRVIRNVNARAETPLWLRERLRRSGLRSLGPLVDITNYVLLELGQPLHAFDLNKLQGGIDVRCARAGETLKLLNNQTVTLDSDTLLITDASGPVALAGIMGGAATAVSDDTTDVFLESAFFAPISIAGRARRLGLHTDASHRFERGVDPQLQEQAIERATRLLLSIAGGQPGPLCEAVAREHLPAETAIRLRPERLHRLLGVAIPAAEVSEILTRLNMAVAEEAGHWLVVPPSFRFDIALEIDLIEEIARVYGYDRLPTRRTPTQAVIRPQSETAISLHQLRSVLVERGYFEAITYSFVDPDSQQLLDPERTPIVLANPISADLAVMRTRLWPGLLKAVNHNQKRQQSRVRLFESGLTFLGTLDDLVQEPYLGGVISGAALPEQWGLPARKVDFFDLKGDVEALLALTGTPEAFAFVPARHPALHPGQSARLERDGVPVGWLGALHPALEQRLELETPVFLFELRLAGLMSGRVPRFAELSKFPASRRDLAVIVAEEVSMQSLYDCIRAHGGDLLREVQLFDVYRGKGIDPGHKSMAFGLILQDFSRNLTDKTIDNIIAMIVTGLQRQLNATLRV